MRAKGALGNSSGSVVQPPKTRAQPGHQPSAPPTMPEARKAAPPCTACEGTCWKNLCMGCILSHAPFAPRAQRCGEKAKGEHISHVCTYDTLQPQPLLCSTCVVQQPAESGRRPSGVSWLRAGCQQRCVQLLQCLRQALEAIPELGLGDDQGWATMQQRRAEEAHQAVGCHGLPEISQGRRRRLAELLDGLAVQALQVDAAEEADGAALLHGDVPLHEGLDLLHHRLLELLGLLREALADGELHALIGTCQSDRVGMVRGTPAQWLVLEPPLDRLSDANHGHRQKGASEALGRGDDIRHHVFKVLEGPEFPRPAEAGHDLVQDEEDAVLVA
mmetsp:Transcript_71522/g.231571  ORF Transcript_71522/g.231571 Transcript_71522/m.231571 type:complete len:331 (+) Transcript_71522:130-1122(+)